MTYPIPGAAAVNFDLSEAPYTPSLYPPPPSYAYTVPAANALNFDLGRTPYTPTADFGDGGGDPDPPDPGIEYPIPPDYMVAYGIGTTYSSSKPSSRAGIGYSMTPAQKAIRAALRFGVASLEMAGRSSQEWGKVPVKDESVIDSAHAWGSVPPRDSDVIPNAWNAVPVQDDLNGGPAQAWDDSIDPIDERIPQPWNLPPAKDVESDHNHADSAKFWERPPPQEGPALYIATENFDLQQSLHVMPGSQALDFDLQSSGDGLEPVEVAVPTRPVDNGRRAQTWGAYKIVDEIRFRHPWDDKPRIGTEQSWDWGVDPNLPDKPQADPPEIKEAYLFMNASYLKKLPEEIPLEFADLSINLDIDSFSWALSCTILNDASMDHIRPGPSGPVEVEAMVNNKKWRFMVERYSVSQQHPERTYRINGSSLTQLLADPYTAKSSAQIDTPTNASAVVQDLLEFTGFSIDWDVTLADYTIPAGAWGYEDKTPIEVIDELVKAAGGIIVPGLNNSTIYAQQRYREGPPWYWEGIDEGQLDFIIADSMVGSLSSEWQPTPEYRGVYVSGITHGVALDLRKTGTDGTPFAPDNYDRLNLSTQQCRGRGIAILGQSGAQEIVTITLPIPTSGAPGLVIPGQWGEIRDTRTPENSWRGLVLSNSVSVAQPGASKATQTLKIERHHYD